jgi:hypothetical protein
LVAVAVFGALIAVSGFLRKGERAFAAEVLGGLRRRAAKPTLEKVEDSREV